MTGTIFISDLHLHASRPDITRTFLRFLAQEARESRALYILGDLFEAWIGDDDTDPHHREIISALRAFTASGVPCFFARGNRDFLVGRRFSAETGVHLLADETIVEIEGQRVLLMHGDVLCSDDVEYQNFRRRVRIARLQAAFLALPLGLRRWVATQVRRRSQARTSGKPEYITDVNASAVAATLRQHGVRHLLHGHTHRPAIHRFLLDGATATRIVLGAWYEQGSMLRWTAAGPELRSLPHD